jgi:hypothetical protein
VWLYAWAVFTTSSLLPRTFPLFACAAIFCAAFAVTRLVGQRGWYVIATGGFHLVLLSVGVGTVLHAILAPHIPIWRIVEWFEALWSWDASHRWFRLGTACFWTVSIYAGGTRLARRELHYQSVAARFDMGLGAFFVLFLIQLLIEVKYDASFSQNLTGYLMLSFFTFGVFAVGLARNHSVSEEKPAGRRRGTGMLSSFSLLIVLAGTGAALLTLPYLSEAARVVHGGMSSVGARVAPVLTRIITFLFRPLAGGTPTGSAGPDTAPLLSAPATAGRLSLFGLILLWTVLGSMGAVTVFLLGNFFWAVLLKLFSRTKTAKRGSIMVYLPFARMMSFFHALYRLIFKRRAALGVVELYTQLVLWGEKSGVARAFHETPLEYGQRLSGQFPDAAPEFKRITNAFNLTVYGEAPEDRAGLVEARGAWRKLLRLWLWLARLKSIRNTEQKPSLSDRGTVSRSRWRISQR